MSSSPLTIPQNKIIELGTLKNSVEIVDFMKKLLIEDEIITSGTFISHTKNDIDASKCKIDHEVQLNWKTIFPYNIALSRAASEPVKSMLYTQRALVFYQIQLFQECVRDIDRALKIEYVHPQKKYLKSIKQRARELYHRRYIQNSYYQVPPKLCSTGKITNANPVVGIQENKQFGKHLVAKKNIQAGEILVVEKPYAAHLLEGDTSFCHHCLELCYDLIPCDKCTFHFYCSEKCKHTCWNEYHQYMCPIFPTLAQLDLLQPRRLLSLKIAIMVSNKEFLTNHLYGKFSDKDIYNSNSIKEVKNLTRNFEDLSKYDIARDGYFSAIMYILVKNHTNYFMSMSRLRRKYAKVTFKRILFMMQQICEYNSLFIREIEGQSVESIVYKETAVGLYSVGSLFNHSCVPNVYYHFYGTTFVARAIKNIRAGDQLYISYGWDYFRYNKITRQSKLLHYYNFYCKCTACVNNWPEWEFMKGELMDSLYENDIMEGDPAVAKKTLPILLKAYLNMGLYQHEPNLSLFSLEQMITFYYNILGNNQFNRII